MGKISVSGIFSGVMATLGQRLLLLLGVLAVFLVLQLGLTWIMGMAMMPDVQSMSAGMPSSPGASIFLSYIVLLAMGCWKAAASNYAASPLTRPDFAGAMGAGGRAVPTLLGAVILLFLGYLVLGIATAIVFVILGFILRGLVAILAIPLVVGLIYVLSRISVVTPVVVVEGERNPITAIARAWNLTANNAGAIFGAVLLFAIASVIVMGATMVPFLSKLAQIGRGPDAMAELMASLGGLGSSTLLMMIVGFVVSLFWTALIPVIHAQLVGPSMQDDTDVFA